MDLWRRIASFFLDIIETIVMALALFVVCYLLFFQPHQVVGASMEPNLHDKEYLLTDKISYRFRQPARGEIVVFRAPKNRELDYIKRIIALPGERIKINAGTVSINDQALKENYLGKIKNGYGGSFLREDQEFVVPKDEYFVMGDNRSHSSDSREWGTINKQDIIGRAWLRYWPFDRLGTLPQIKY